MPLFLSALHNLSYWIVSSILLGWFNAKPTYKILIYGKIAA